LNYISSQNLFLLTCSKAGFLFFSSLKEQDPDRFDADHFAPPHEEDKQHPFALVGFGSGPHGCLGLELTQMELKLIVSTLLRDYDWTIIPEKATIAPIRQPSKMQARVRAKFVEL